MAKRKINPNSLKNLKPPIKKGEVRNPTGRPKGALGLTTLLKKALEEDYFVYEKDEKGNILKDEKGKPKILKKITKKDALIYALASKAIADKDMQAIKEIFDRIDGKVETKSSIDHTTKGQSLNSKIDLSKLSDKELAILEKLHNK